MTNQSGPNRVFKGQNAAEFQTKMDTTTTFSVFGGSGFGV
jgi:hypothetical protein